ncbi:MAG: hypothetical protein HAW61_05070 [Candidatus Portiera sp.]|nr:hypothetical protein [Portiera sp.]
MQLISFYWFADLADCEEWCESLNSRISSDFPEIRGTVLLAPEGVNAALCGEKEQLDDIIKIFREDDRFAVMPVRRFPIKKYVFTRIKIKCRKEIINFRIDDPLTDIPPAKDLNAAQWNQLMADKDTLVLDARNSFEFDVGSFPDAINPQVERFSHLASYIDENKDKLLNKKVAIFCTGGIRCEKLGKYMKKQGIQDVYQLEGGILQYFQDTKGTDNLWEGECFVFDERISVSKQDL